MFLRLTVIWLIIFCVGIANADTIDYDVISITPARKLFSTATEYLARHQEDTAMAYYMYTIGACEKENDPRNSMVLAKSYNELGKCYFGQGYYAKAFDAFMKAVKICDTYGETSLLPHIYNNLGSVYSTWNDIETGSHYFKRALAATDSMSQNELYVKLLINIIGNACRKKDVAEAWRYYNILRQQYGNDDITDYFILINKGLILCAEEKRKEAVVHIGVAAEFAERHGLSPQYMGYAYSTLGNLYEPERGDSALFFYHKALELDNPPYLKRSLLKDLARLYRKRNPVMADDYDRRYLLISDSLFNEEEINRTRSAQFLYESEKNFQEMMRLGEEKKRQAEEIRKQRKTIVVAFSVSAVFLMLMIIIYRKTVTIRKAYRNLFIQNKERIEEGIKSKEIQQQLIRRIEQLTADIACLGRTGERQVGTIQGNDTDEDDTADYNDVTPGIKLQSADKLTDERKNIIMGAINEVVERGEEIFDCDFGIETLAELTGFNSKYLSKVINETCNCNFRTFINGIRIRESQRRLLDAATYGAYTISAIARSVGYRSHANFILLFKKQTGLSPSAFQKMAREDTRIKE